ncbi:MAG: hypothetical protein PHF83_05410 [Candidatus Methanomethylophilus sp.]|nr:hypothetical protein [Methanomethylophilus sp.]
MHDSKVIGIAAVLLCAVLVLAVPAADVSAADTSSADVTVTVANTDDGNVSVTFTVPADYANAKDLGTITAYNGVVTYNAGFDASCLTAELASYVTSSTDAAKGVTADGTVVTVPATSQMSVPDADTVSDIGAMADSEDATKLFSSVNFDTVTVVYTTADLGQLYTADEIAAIQAAASDAAVAAYADHMSPEDVQAAVDAAVADALANVPADSENTVFGLDIPTFCIITALLLIIVAGLGVVAYKNGLFSKKKEGSE